MWRVIAWCGWVDKNYNLTRHLSLEIEVEADDKQHAEDEALDYCEYWFGDEPNIINIVYVKEKK